MVNLRLHLRGLKLNIMRLRHLQRMFQGDHRTMCLRVGLLRSASLIARSSGVIPSRRQQSLCGLPYL